MSRNGILYASVIPENNRASYGEFDVVDFRCQFPGRAMNLNSVRISGTFQVKNELGVQVTDEHCQLDSLVGSHSFWDRIQVFSGGQSIDNIMEYPRMVKMLTSATQNPADMFNSSNLCELKAPNDLISEEMLRQETVPVQLTTPVKRDLDFSCKPMMALNQVYSARRRLNYSQSGDVRVVFTLARNNAVLFGVECKQGYSYSLSDLRLEFTSVPDDGDNTEPIMFKRRQGLKQSFASSSAQLNFNYPMMASRVYGSFLAQGDENQPQDNNLALQKPPSVSNLTFFFNNTTNEYVSYEMRSQSEIVERAIDAIGETGRNSASLMNLANNNGYLIGMNLNEMVDLMNTKFSVVVESGLQSGTPMLLFLYAEGIGQLQ
jgi:hypothetical protein